MEIIEKLKELLVPVFGLSSADEIKSDHSLVNDLGAESLDFVEITYLIESHFGVVLKTNEIMIGGANVRPDDLFTDGKLTDESVEFLKKTMPNKTFAVGQTKRDLFGSITVEDLAIIVESKMKQ